MAKRTNAKQGLESMCKSFYVLKFLFLLAFLMYMNLNVVYVKDDLLAWNIKEEFQKYEKNIAESYRVLCDSTSLNLARSLLKEYQRFQLYIPVDDKTQDLSKEVIQKFLPKYQKKIEWIQHLITLKQTKSQIRKLLVDLEELKTLVENLIEYKEHMYFSVIGEKYYQNPSQIQITSALQLRKKLKEKYFEIIAKFPRLHSFEHPVDLESLRSDYENLKLKGGRENILKSQEIYFYRKMVEDGAGIWSESLKKLQSPDYQLRALINTLHFRLDRDESILLDKQYYPTFYPIDDDEQMDVLYLVEILKSKLNDSETEENLKLQNWKKIVEEQLDRYQLLLKEPNRFKDENLLKKTAQDQLKKLVAEKQSQAFKFWSSKGLWQEVLYVMEQIIVNEVGNIDTERRDESEEILRILYRRVNHPKYSKMRKSQLLMKSLLEKKLTIDQVNHHKWLSSLFREGEFSFTYFFIPANENLWCQPNHSVSKNIRQWLFQFLEKNYLEFQKPVFLPTSQSIEQEKMQYKMRYFSRLSMLGRMNIAKTWKDYKQNPIQVGKLIENQKIYQIRKKQKKLKYKHHFFSEDGNLYIIFEDKASKKRDPFILYNHSKKQYYQYRNTHYFRYFYPM
jgi:hypothetical protein